MIVKIHSTPNGKMLAICDSELLGKKFEEGNMQLDLASNFYQGEKKTSDEVTKLIKDCYIINAVGEESVQFLLDNELIEESNIKKIDNIPHAQCVVSLE